MNTCNGITRTSQLTTSLFATPACQLTKADTDWFPAVDVTETENEYVAEVDLPGLKPDEIELRVDSGELCISGRRPQVPAGGRRVRTERPAGVFIRQLPLPPDAQGEIRAIFHDGVLELRVARVCPKN